MENKAKSKESNSIKNVDKVEQERIQKLVQLNLNASKTSLNDQDQGKDSNLVKSNGNVNEKFSMENIFAGGGITVLAAQESSKSNKTKSEHNETGAKNASNSKSPFVSSVMSALTVQAASKRNKTASINKETNENGASRINKTFFWWSNFSTCRTDSLKKE